MGSSPEQDPRAQLHNYAIPRLGKLLSPEQDTQTQTIYFVSAILA